MPKPRQAKTPPRPAPDRVEATRAEPPASAAIPPPRARLGHPNATAYVVPEISAPPAPVMPRTPPRQQPPLRESEFPVYWVEVLDAAHQKWQPVDALATYTMFRPNKLEPPAADRGNCLSYVVAFEEGGFARDVTRRYAKAYNAKTRRMRVDGPLIPEDDGKKWWRKVMRRYKQPGARSDLDQIEDNELSGFEAREPMPRNVADFKDHPVYALERHMRRHEVLAPDAPVVGKVGAGSKGPLEKIYRRRDVRAAKSVDKWYRLGREINPGEEPVKVLPKRKRLQRRGRRAVDDDQDDSSSSDDPVLGPSPLKGVPIFTFDQTSLYVPPPVVAGRIPKNKFGNLDLYVPSMVPAGGAHIPHPRAGHAAHILGVDYAPALTGFDWRGRKGTAVYNGVVVPAEAEEGVRAVIDGFEDLEVMLEEEKRSKRALATWRRLLRGMRIRKSVFGDEDVFDESVPLEDFPVDEDEMDDRDPDQYGGDFEADHSQAGGFEPGGFEPGGFEPRGFEPGGFEPGGFEPDDPNVDVKDKGKGKATAIDLNRGSVQTPGDNTAVHRRQRVKRRVVESDDEDMEDEQDAAAPAEETQPDDSNTQPPTQMAEPCGFEIEPALQDPPPMEETEAVVTAAETVDAAVQEDPEPNGPEASGDPGAVLDGTVDADVTTVEKPDDPEGVRDEAEKRQQDGGEDTDLDDVASDVTEELYMDEDGSLIE